MADEDDEFSDPEGDDSPLRGPQGHGDDDFDEFEDSMQGGGDPSPVGRGQTKKVQKNLLVCKIYFIKWKKMQWTLVVQVMNKKRNHKYFMIK